MIRQLAQIEGIYLTGKRLKWLTACLELILIHINKIK